jgi:nicotinate-nucleotide--dimethylbenzimidazole phosphoribosyltransferase
MHLPTLVTDFGDLNEQARVRLDSLTKPQGALGRLEDIAAQLCLIAGQVPAPVPASPAIVVFAADHGVVADGVTQWPSEVTAQMVANFASGGAAINVIARATGATLTIVDVGVLGDTTAWPTVRQEKVAAGTASLAKGPAMTAEQRDQAFEVGTRMAHEVIDGGADLVVAGDMGIGNTTASAALISALTDTSAHIVTGRGTGIDDSMLAHKTTIVNAAVTRSRGFTTQEVIASLGGLEIVAMAGFMTAAAFRRVPIIVDGVIALAAAVVADALVDGMRTYLIAGHRSSEPGATVALEHLGLLPLLDIAMRLGEGSGAAIAIPIVQSAAALLCHMATFADAAIVDQHGSPTPVEQQP